ncbi:MAG: class I SAM-dependent methyltransferase [Deltaproteobacteria bacterium]|nr:class I SAM-dependent methyltransferase [Deltaproteobacteria bacterium]
MIDAARLSEILLRGVNLRLVEPHLYSPYAPGEQTNSYDDKGALSFYDQVACSRLYNRLVWGYSTANYHSVVREVLNSSTEGWVLDAGCGALAFTAKTYADYDERPVVFLDQSITLLRLAKARLAKLTGAVPDNVVFLHGDVRELPFKPKSFGTIIALNLLHVLDDVAGVLRALRKILLDEGTIAFTTLIETNRLADRYLHMWGRAGELVPRTAPQLLAIFEGLGMPVTYRIRGNMAFITYG